jgi:hypothetical protein
MQIGENAIRLQRKLYLDSGGSDEALLPYMEREIPAGPTTPSGAGTMTDGRQKRTRMRRDDGV